MLFGAPVVAIAPTVAEAAKKVVEAMPYGGEEKEIPMRDDLDCVSAYGCSFVTSDIDITKLRGMYIKK